MVATASGMEYLSSNTSIRNQLASVSSTTPTTEHSRSNVSERYSREILNYVFQDNYVEGEVGKTQLYLENLYITQGVDVFRESFQFAWVRLFTKENPSYLYTLACIASGLPFEWFEHYGIVALLGCSTHRSELVNEACIRMAESWEHPEHSEYLESMRTFDFEWLEEYKQETIGYLKSL